MLAIFLVCINFFKYSSSSLLKAVRKDWYQCIGSFLVNCCILHSRLTLPLGKIQQLGEQSMSRLMIKCVDMKQLPLSSERTLQAAVDSYNFQKWWNKINGMRDFFFLSFFVQRQEQKYNIVFEVVGTWPVPTCVILAGTTHSKRSKLWQERCFFLI